MIVLCAVTAACTGAPSPPETAAGTAPGRPAPAPSADPAATPSGGPDRATVTFDTVRLPAGVAPEASGLAAGDGPGQWFLVDDATGTDEVVAVSVPGDGPAQLLGRYRVEGMDAGNAEALTRAPCDPGAPGDCLFVGDIGDHVGRPSVTVHRLPVPTVPTDAGAAPTTITVAADAWEFTYPDPGTVRDAESLLVDRDGSLLIIGKPESDDPRTVLPHPVWRGQAGGGALVQVGSITPPGPERAGLSLFTGTVITDAALVGDRVLVLTYDQVLEYTPPSPEAPIAGVGDWPWRRLPTPDLVQAEAISGPAGGGCGLAVASEAGPLSDTATLAVGTCR
ncbi:hypothetical protein [Nakamurella leprariae]|uniref:Uncharacterized protein n=1 Tax=Nakamurella leprariae TaxID=2803911 RepID=A0A939BYR9_9ACTN|nr:hypothetical protein [Nakamurella leprariae]MBM9467380.1 hypothetical protein [Nakamurella leprariae]